MINAKIVSKQEIVSEYKLKAKSDLGTHCWQMLLIMEDESVDRTVVDFYNGTDHNY